MTEPGWQERTAALVLVIGAAAFLLWFGLRTGWVPLSVECAEHPECFPASGETLISTLAGRRLVLDGSRYWFLQNLRPPWEPDAEPLLYTHHANLAAVIYYGLARLGADEPTVASVWIVIAAFCVGLYYAWLFVRRVSGSAEFAVTFLLLMVSEYHFNLVFGVNVLRGWHWLALFGSGYHFARWMASAGKWTRVHAMLFCIWTVVTFQIGYDLMAVHICTMLLLIASQYWWNLGTVQPVRTTGWLLLIAALIPLAVRQVQVIGVLGPEFWAKDLYYTAMLKVPFVSAIFPLPVLSEVDEFYRRHNAVRLMASPWKGMGSILALAASFWQAHWSPYLGWIRSVVSLVSMVLSAAVVGILVARQVPARRVESWNGEGGSCSCRLARPAITVWVIAGGQVLGLLVFAQYTVWFWVRYAFPLLISSIAVALAFGVYVLLECVRWARRQDWRRRTMVVAVCGSAILLLAAEQVIQQVKNYRATEFLGPGEGQLVEQEMMRKLPSYGVSSERKNDK